jgi:hypothetical protein
MTELMTPQEVERHFTRADGSYAFARWNRPIAPVIFGVEDATVSTFKGAIEAVVALADHRMAETDPELGSNFMIFFLRDWEELTQTPNLDKLIPDLGPLTQRLQAQEATQYRAFRFDDEGGIQACFLFIRVDEKIAQMSAETLALGQVVQSVLLWSESAFAERSPLGRTADGGAAILRPEIAGLIRAAYDPVMPVSANDPSHALRLFARLQQTQ